MGDSDNSTALPSVTRRRLIAGAAAAGTAWPFGVSAHENTSRKVLREDPALHLCEKWREAHDNTLALCRKQQLLETELVRTVGFPNAQLRLASEDVAPTRSIDGGLGVFEDDAIRDLAIDKLAAHQARWDAIDERIGYSRMDCMIRQSEAAEQALLDDLLRSPATTIHGVLAKLSVILFEGEHREDPDDFPWLHIRALRDDLCRLHGLDTVTTPSSEKQQNSKSR